MSVDGRKCFVCLSHFAVINMIGTDVKRYELLNKFKLCIPILRSQHLQSPFYMCSTCIYQAEECFEFQEQCVKNSSILIGRSGNNASVFTCGISCKAEENSLLTFAKEVEPVGDDDKKLCATADCKDSFTNIISSTHEQGDKFFCGICTKEFDRKVSLRLHVRNHATEGTYICTYCGKCFYKSYGLVKHLEKCDNNNRQTYSCKTCKRTFFSTSNLNAHVNRIHRKEPACCCRKVVTIFKSKLDNQEDTVEEEVMQCAAHKKLICDFCGKAYNKSYLISHMRTHTGDKKYVCYVCGKRFAQYAGLRVHLRMHRGLKSIARCALCSRMFSSSEGLEKHMNYEHYKTQPYKCDICGKCFYSKACIRSHIINIHICKETITCNVCNKPFKSKGRAKAHAIMHSANRPYICDICGQGFRRKSELNTHITLHTGAKPFRCEICGVAFRQGAHLRNHTLLHTGHMPYSCDYCGRYFRHKSSLLCHINHHNEQKQNQRYS